MIYTGKKSANPGVLDRGEHRALEKALREADLKRRAGEARAFLERGKHPELAP